MQPNRASRRAIIEIDINEVAQGSDTPRTSSRQSSARTSQQRQGSLDQRAGRHGTSSGEQGSLDSGSLNPHASQQGSLNPRVAGTGSLDPGSLDQRAARPRTSGSSMSILPQAPEAAGVVSATEALPVSVATRFPPTATAVSVTSSGSTRPPIQWGVGIPVRSSTSSSSSSRPPIPEVRPVWMKSSVDHYTLRGLTWKM